MEILPGTVIHIPAGVKHWHGAQADGWFAHLAFEVPGEETWNEWPEPLVLGGGDGERLGETNFISIDRADDSKSVFALADKGTQVVIRRGSKKRTL